MALLPRSRHRKHRRALNWGMVFLGAFPLPLGAQAQTVLDTVQSIRSLSSGQAAQGVPVHLSGVVTVPSTYKNSFFFMDGTGGVSIDRPQENTAVYAGDRVEIEGATASGQFAPVVSAARVRVIGRETLPTPRLYELNELAGGQRDSQWIAVRGVIRSAGLQTVWDRKVLVLDFDMGVGGTIPVHVRDFPAAGWEKLPGSIVRIRAVCGTIFNDRRQFVSLRLFTSSLASIEIEKPAPADPFDTPLASLDQLLLFHGQGGSLERIRVRGTVTYLGQGQEFFLQNGQRGILVHSLQDPAVQPGSQVEVVGYLASGRYSPELEDAQYRQIAGTAPVAPSDAVASAMVAMSSDGFVASPYDSMLVRVKGEVLQEVIGSSEDSLILQDGETYFSALMPRSRKRERLFPPGTVLRVTGVCVTRFDSTSNARHFRILLRSPADVVVLRTAPWWTVEHTGWAVAVGLLIVLAGVGVRAFVRRDRELHTLAISDPLTGLYNRRGFYQLFSHDWARARRSGSTLLIFYIDLDRFKQINDTLGHKAGDETLRAVAELLRGCFRNADVIARMGGDEFAVACDASADSPATIEERLEQAIARYNAAGSGSAEISLSVGSLVCDSSLSNLSVEELMARADEMMYARKKAGRTAVEADLSVRVK